MSNLKTRKVRTLRRLESLERRDLLAGDVSFSVSRGDLFIRGDFADNHLEVIRQGEDTVIRGLDGTTINGESVDFTVQHLTDDIRASLGRGNNSIRFVDIQVPDDLYFRGGHDSIAMVNVSADTILVDGTEDITFSGVEASRILVDTSSGDDSVSITDTTVHRDLSLRGYNLTAGVVDTTVERDFVARLSGESTLLIKDSEIKDDTRIGSSGQTHVVIEDSQHLDDVSISTWWQDDFISLDGVTIGDDVSVSLGWGDDVLSAVDTTFGDRTTLSGSRGHDALNAVDVEFARDPHISGFDQESVPDLDQRITAVKKKLEDAGVVVESKPTILDLVVENEDFSTLETALGAAGLAETFGQDGTFTVFAPTNEAFAALGDALDTIVADVEELTRILTYHVAGDELSRAELSGLDSVKTLQGQNISVEVTEDTLILNGNVQVVTADIEASNGIVHVIDTVLIPGEDLPTIAEIVVGNDDFETLLVALQTADLVDTFTGDGDFTVFAPTDAAFEAIEPSLLEAVLADPDGLLTEILTYHVVGESLDSSELAALPTVRTLQGQDISLEIVGEDLILNGNIKVAPADILASNGVVHVIDTVLIPAAPTIADVVAGNEQLSQLNRMLEGTGLDDTLKNGEFTLFAPVNSGLISLNPRLVELLIQFAPSFLEEILLNHVVEGRFDAATLLAGGPVTTLGGFELELSATEEGAQLSNVAFTPTVLEADIQAENGIVHIIDTVVLGRFR